MEKLPGPTEDLRTPAAHLDGDGEQLPLLVQVQEAQRRRQVRLLSVDLIGRYAVQHLIIQQVDGPFLYHGDRAAVTTCNAGARQRVRGGRTHLELLLEGGAFRQEGAEHVRGDGQVRREEAGLTHQQRVGAIQTLVAEIPVIHPVSTNEP